MANPSQKCGPGAEGLFEDERLYTLLTYWHSRCKDGRFPSRQDIDPLELTPLLPGIWLCDHEPDNGTIRYRLAGEEINAAFGMSIRGRLLSDFTDEATFQRINDYLLPVMQKPAVFYTSGMVHKNIDRFSTGERLALPLQTESDQANGILGVTLTEVHPIPVEGDVIQKPFRCYFSIPEIFRLLEQAS